MMMMMMTMTTTTAIVMLTIVSAVWIIVHLQYSVGVSLTLLSSRDCTT